MQKTNWQTKKLGEVCDVLDNKRRPVTQRDRISGEYPYYGATGILDYVDDYIFDEKLILIGEDGAKWGAGENTAFIADGKYWVNNHAHVIRPHRHIILDNWIVYFLYVTDLSKYITGLTVQKLNQGKLLEIEIPLPPLPEQKRIVGILDKAFAAISTAKANAEKNLQNARELFESYLQSVFANPGEGLVEKRLGDVCGLIDCLHKTPTYVESGLPMVRVTDIKPGYLCLSNTRRVDEKTFNEFSKKHAPKAGDIVFSRVGSYGVSSLVNSDNPFCLGQNTVFIIPKINSLLLYYFLNSPVAKNQFDELVDGTTQPTISLKSIREVRFSVPSPRNHKKLVVKLDGVSSETQRLESIYRQKLADLDELKKSVLQKAFNGGL